jgi:predicted enzyme related to lactoylglutathione lyase
MITAIQQIAVNVQDVDRARAFYRDKLGVRHLFDGGPKLTFFDCGGVRLMLGTPEKPEFDHPSSVLYFKVGDIRAAHRELSSRGVAFRDTPHMVAKLPDREVWMAFFDDSEGNLLAITSEPPAAS